MAMKQNDAHHCIRDDCMYRLHELVYKEEKKQKLKTSEIVSDAWFIVLCFFRIMQKPYTVP